MTFSDGNAILKLNYLKIIYVIAMAGSGGPGKGQSLTEDNKCLF